MQIDIEYPDALILCIGEIEIPHGAMIIAVEVQVPIVLFLDKG